MVPRPPKDLYTPIAIKSELVVFTNKIITPYPIYPRSPAMKYQSTTLIFFAALATVSLVDDELVNQVRRALLVPNHHST
jgi:hypothetical protein